MADNSPAPDLDDKAPKPEPKDAAPPASPPTVKKTPLKTPREIELEKKVSVLEDKTTALEGTITEINNFLADLGIGSGKPAPKLDADPAKPAPPRKGGVFAEIERDIWG